MRDAVMVVCERCGAGQKQPCVSRYGNKVSYFHAAREADARSGFAEVRDRLEVANHIAADRGAWYEES